MRDLAGKLLAASARSAELPSQEPLLVNEKLRISLTQFAGADGFASLLRRALSLASAEVPALKDIKVNARSGVERPSELVTDAGAIRTEAALAVTAHMLQLLVTFIGEPLTRRLVREACPEASLEE